MRDEVEPVLIHPSSLILPGGSMSPPDDPVPLFGPEMTADPYPLYHRLRSVDPVCWSERYQAWICLGDGTMDLVIRNLDTNEEIFTAQMPIRFPDRVVEVRVLFRINRCSFPAPGEYLCTLLLDNEWVAQRSLQIIERDQ
jgi:hypothetical protein